MKKKLTIRREIVKDLVQEERKGQYKMYRRNSRQEQKEKYS